MSSQQLPGVSSRSIYTVEVVRIHAIQSFYSQIYVRSGLGFRLFFRIRGFLLLRSVKCGDCFFFSPFSFDDCVSVCLDQGGMSNYSGYTKLCKGLAVVLVVGHIVVQILPAAVSYIALIPAK